MEEQIHFSEEHSQSYGEMAKQAAPVEGQGKSHSLWSGLLAPTMARALDPLGGALECRFWPTLWN